MGSGLYALEGLFESGSGRQARRFRPQAHQIAAIQSGTPLAEIGDDERHFSPGRITDIESSSLRELDLVALATNVKVTRH